MKAIVHKEQSLSGVNNKSFIIASNDLSWTDTSILGKGVKDNMLIARSSSYSLTVFFFSLIRGKFLWSPMRSI